MSIVLLVDSCCDLPLDYIENNKDIIEVIGMPVNIDGKEYIDDLGKTLSHGMLYTKLKEGVMPLTSQINVTTFLSTYKELYNKGKDIVYIGFSSGLSGTINNAHLAKDMLLEDYEDANVDIIDSLGASIGLGVLIMHAAELIRRGEGRDDVVDWIESNKLKSNHWFAVDDLIHLKNGGRIPAAIALIGTVLNVKPILTVDLPGKLKSHANVRGRKKSFKYLINKYLENLNNLEETIVIIGHGNCRDDAEKIKELIIKEGKPKQIIISELSATIATHVGPGMIAIAFIGKNIRCE